MTLALFLVLGLLELPAGNADSQGCRGVPGTSLRDLPHKLPLLLWTAASTVLCPNGDVWSCREPLHPGARTAEGALIFFFWILLHLSFEPSVSWQRVERRSHTAWVLTQLCHCGHPSSLCLRFLRGNRQCLKKYLL